MAPATLLLGQLSSFTILISRSGRTMVASWTDHGAHEAMRGPHDKCLPNNLLGRQRKFPTRHRRPPLAPRFNGRRSAVRAFLLVLPWLHGRQPGPARRLVGCTSDFPQGGWDEPDFLPCRRARHSWWHRDAIAAAQTQRGRHDHLAGQLQHLLAPDRYHRRERGARPACSRSTYPFASAARSNSPTTRPATLSAAGRAQLSAGDDVSRLLPCLQPFARRSPSLSSRAG